MRKSVVLMLAPAGAAAAIGAIVVAGPLDPPVGPVASSFKTLAEVEPRTAIQSLAGNDTARYVITRPGAYYLTADASGVAGKVGIEIHTGNVSIDLNGFSLVGVPGSREAIWAPGGDAKPALSVSNGAVSGWGGNGVDLELHASARVDNVRAHHNTGSGILVGEAGVVTNSQAATNGGYGFWASQRAVISHCTATGNTDDGFRLGFECLLDHAVASGNTQDGFETNASAVISECTASANGQVGFRLGDSSTITRSTANANTEQGISGVNAISADHCIATHNSASGIALLGQGNSVTGCVVRRNARDGIRVFSTSQVTGCTADGNAFIRGNFHAGIRLIGQANRAEGNYLSANDIGLRIDGQGNLAVRNSLTFNPTRVSAEPGNNVAQIIVVPGNDFVSTDPWANFAH